MKKEEYHKTCWGFEIFPFIDKGIVKSTIRKEYIDSNGYRVIRNKKGDKIMISHLIWAVGTGFPRGYYKSLKQMKNYIIKYKDGNKTNCNFDNLICLVKVKYQKHLDFNKRVGEMF